MTMIYLAKSALVERNRRSWPVACLMVGIAWGMVSTAMGEPQAGNALPRASTARNAVPSSQLGAPVQLGVWAHRHERSHAYVKSAFRQVVAPASRGTVKVLCDRKQVALGTVVDAEGYILTKHSQLTGGVMECELKDGRSLPAKIVGVHRDSDLVMLRVQPGTLTPVRFSDQGPPPIGSWLATPGLGDLPEAIGIVSALPCKSAAPVGVLGVLLGDAQSGPSVDEILPGSAALRAGLKAGDIILRVNEQTTANRSDLVQAIRGYHPGEIVSLQVVRGDKTEEIRARLRARAGDPAPGSLEYQNRMGGSLSERRTGFPLVLQHDSVLEPTDCGGPLVDLDGRVVGINIARAGRVASLALPANLVLGLIDDLKSGKLAPPTWSVGIWQSPWEELDAKIASLQKSLHEAEQVRTEAEFRLRRSETVVRRALVEKAAAQLREVDARQDVVKRLRAASDRRNAERAVEQAETPFEAARQQVEAADETIHSILEQLVTAREQQADLAVK